MEMEKLMQVLIARRHSNDKYTEFISRGSHITDAEWDEQYVSHTFHITTAEFKHELRIFLDQNGMRFWHDNDLLYYLLVEGVCSFVGDVVRELTNESLKRLGGEIKSGSRQEKMAALTKSVRRFPGRAGQITVCGDIKYPGMIWSGGVQSRDWPAILHVIYQDEFDREELVKEAFASDAHIRTLIILEIPVKPFGMERESWDQTASIHCWRSNGTTGAIPRQPGDRCFRRADGSAGVCQLELSISDFLPHTQSNAETDAMIIKADMEKMLEHLRDPEEQYHEFSRLKERP
ncbi:hypothetical protein LTS10_008699 [Elasticomyces elasticus]|nr:hypothetical protein LTS10_008699 [Elasticomyces elasticus]